MRWAACCYYLSAVHPSLLHAWGELLVATTGQPYNPPFFMHEVSCLLLQLASRTPLPSSCMRWAACCYYLPAVHPSPTHAWGELLVATTCQPYIPTLLMHDASCLLLIPASRRPLPATAWYELSFFPCQPNAPSYILPVFQLPVSHTPPPPAYVCKYCLFFCCLSRTICRNIYGARVRLCSFLARAFLTHRAPSSIRFLYQLSSVQRSITATRLLPIHMCTV